MPITYKFDTVGTGISFSAGGKTYGPPTSQVNIELDENGDEVTIRPILSGLFPKIVLKASASTIQVNSVAFSGTGLQLYQQLRALFPSSNSGSAGSGYLGPMTRTQIQALTGVSAGTRVYNTTDGWYETYDTFWGFMPVYLSNEWKKKYGFEYFRDFPNANNDGYLGQILTNSGSFTSNAGPGTTSEQSMTIAYNTNSLANGAASMLSNGSTLVLGSGITAFDARMYLPVLSTSSERYQTIVGFHDNPTGPNQVDGIYLLYDEGGVSTSSTASPNWIVVNASNSARVFQVSSIPVVAATWYMIRAEVNAAGTLARLYVNGTQVGTDITTGIPTGQTRSMGFGMSHIKSVGTTNRTALLNLIGAKQKYTNPR